MDPKENGWFCKKLKMNEEDVVAYTTELSRCPLKVLHVTLCGFVIA